MLYTNSLWVDDLDKAINAFSGLNRLDGKTVLVTGATGLICSAVVDLLLRYNDTHAGTISILVAGRSIERLVSRFCENVERSDIQFLEYDSSKSNVLPSMNVDYIIHGASNASPSKIMKEPVETMLSNFLGLKELMEFAISNNTKRLLFISSSEVYGGKDDSEPYKENQYGYIDLLQPRNSYSVSKRAAETLCISYAAEYDVNTVIVRPGHIYGPTASKDDNRVSSAWAYAVARGEDIIMKSDGSQIRSYCYCLDCATAILRVLLDGKNTFAYNISNPRSIISIREMAELLTRSAGVQLKCELPTHEEKHSFNPMKNSSLNSSELESLGWKGIFDAEEGFSHTITILQGIV